MGEGLESTHTLPPEKAHSSVAELRRVGERVWGWGDGMVVCCDIQVCKSKSVYTDHRLASQIFGIQSSEFRKGLE